MRIYHVVIKKLSTLEARVFIFSPKDSKNNPVYFFLYAEFSLVVSF